MSKANLLLDIESFNIIDLINDYSSHFDELALTFDCATEHGDTVFGHPNVYNHKLPWGFLHEILFFDYEEKLKLCPWLNYDHQKILLKLFNHSVSATPSYNLNDLENEFQGDNNGLLSIDNTTLNNISNPSRWANWHTNYISNNLSLRDTDYEYFKRFYRPVLVLPLNQINDLINKKKAHKFFKRLDQPSYIEDGIPLHGEQIHIHFNDDEESALNINGTWKHGLCEIPKEAQLELKNWGFLLPTE